ncbi:prohibitin-1, mitochondrial-like [Arachis duranensis]|uniref:Prohibitin n=1 Tax=Arachis duranensis TaxID=130453 RepID=A0A9C6TKT3_ARADU|nr:prohibitin-1, mitochondrial-like [Arachis duranensis]
MVLSPPAGIVGAFALFSSPISSHLSSSRHHRTKESLTPWHNRHEGFPVDRHLFKRAPSLSLTLSVSELRALYRSLLNVSREIRKMLTERASHFNIALDDVSITSLTFGKEFTAAIEAKQVAAQEAERAKFVVEKAEQDKRSAVIRAQGEAKSAQLIGQAIANNPAFITLRKIEAAREIAHTISNSANKVYLNSDDLFIAT